MMTDNNDKQQTDGEWIAASPLNAALFDLFSKEVGKTGESEGLIDVARRIVQERDAYRNGNRDLHEENQRLRKANGMMEAVIEDLYGKHDGETCGRVQCNNALSNAKRRYQVLEAKIASLDGWESLAKYIAGDAGGKCDTCGATRDPETGWCPYTDAGCDERAGLR